MDCDVDTKQPDVLHLDSESVGTGHSLKPDIKNPPKDQRAEAPCSEIRANEYDSLLSKKHAQVSSSMNSQEEITNSTHQGNYGKEEPEKAEDRGSEANRLLDNDDHPKDSESPLHELSKEEEEEEGFEDRIPDGGWGWMVLLGTLIISILAPLSGPTFTISLSQLLKDLRLSSTTIAWLFNVQAFTFNMAALIVGPLSEEFGWRKVVFAGTGLLSASFILSVFANSAECLFFTFSLLSGIGGGLPTAVGFLILPNYFRFRRGRVLSIMVAGFCLAQFILPVTILHLQEEYGHFSSVLIFGALMLHGFVAGAMFHPISWHLKPKKKRIKDGAEIKLFSKGQASNDSKISDRVRMEENASDDYTDISKDSTHIQILLSENRPYKNHTSFVRRYESRASLSSFGSVELASTTHYQVNKSSLPKLNHHQRCASLVSLFHVLMRVAISTGQNLTILRSPRAVIVSVGCAAVLCSYVNFVMMLPFFIEAKGHAIQDSAWCLSIAGIFNLVTRLIMTVVSDMPRLNRPLFHVAGAFILSAATVAFAVIEEMKYLLVIMAVWGTGVGLTMSLFGMVMIDILGLDLFPRIFGSTCFMTAFTYLLYGPIVGWVRDATQSYNSSVFFLGATGFTTVIVWMFMPLAARYDERRQTKAVSEAV